MNLTRGSRYVWWTTGTTTEPQALESPNKAERTAATYYDPNQIEVQLNFTAAYSGALNLYAVDWESGGRQEMVTVDGQTAMLSNFSQGAWMSFPVNVPAGGVATIIVDRTAGLNAVLSGIFLD